MTEILHGDKVRDMIAEKLCSRRERFSFEPVLAIISLGDATDLSAYMRAKELFARKIGVSVRLEKLPEAYPEEKLFQLIDSLNADKKISGIIIQLPLPKNLNTVLVLDSVDPGKDVDALTSTSLRRFYDGSPGALVPATARGVLSLLKYYSVSVAGKRAVVVGRSPYVGKALALALLSGGATVTICHSGTDKLEKITSEAEILVSAAGVPNLIGINHVNPLEVVVDVGITDVGEGETSSGRRKIRGDVDYEKVKDKVAMISPVPGGVGPLTVASLFENLFDLIEKNQARKLL